MQKARRHPAEAGLRPLVSVRFQVLFTTLVGVLFIFQSPYWFTIGRQGVFSLGRWSSLFHAGFHEPHATLEHLGLPFIPLQDWHLLWSGFQAAFTERQEVPYRCPQPRAEARFGLFRVRSPLLTESRFLSFPLGTEMFQFSRFASTPYAFRCGWPLRAGFPHSEIPGSKLGCQLPWAYRRLPRLSSPLDAKTSSART
jgi:hypothetical protein